MTNKNNNVDDKCPKKCKDCEYRKIIMHSVVPYNFCTKLNALFCGGEPGSFLIVRNEIGFIC